MKIADHIVGYYDGTLTTVTWNKYDLGTDLQERLEKYLTKKKWYYSHQNKWWQKNRTLIEAEEFKALELAKTMSRRNKIDYSKKKASRGIQPLLGE